MNMKGYKIIVRVESDKRYLKVLNFELRRRKRRKVFRKTVAHELHHYCDGSWGVTIAGHADDEALIAFIELLIDERDKGNLSICSMRLYESKPYEGPFGFVFHEEEIVV